LLNRFTVAFITFSFLTAVCLVGLYINLFLPYLHFEPTNNVHTVLHLFPKQLERLKVKMHIVMQLCRHPALLNFFADAQTHMVIGLCCFGNDEASGKLHTVDWWIVQWVN